MNNTNDQLFYGREKWRLRLTESLSSQDKVGSKLDHCRPLLLRLSDPSRPPIVPNVTAVDGAIPGAGAGLGFGAAAARDNSRRMAGETVPRGTGGSGGEGLCFFEDTRRSSSSNTSIGLPIGANWCRSVRLERAPDPIDAINSPIQVLYSPKAKQSRASKIFGTARRGIQGYSVCWASTLRTLVHVSRAKNTTGIALNGFKSLQHARNRGGERISLWKGRSRNWETGGCYGYRRQVIFAIAER